MNKVIEQTIRFKGARAKDLFDIFVDPKKHSIIHGGAKSKISAKEGDTFSLLDGNLNGRNLRIIPDKMIVQSWRGNVWLDGDHDSILALVFAESKDGAEINMVHAFTPKQFTELWNEVYWQPIKEFLKREKAGS